MNQLEEFAKTFFNSYKGYLVEFVYYLDRDFDSIGRIKRGRVSGAKKGKNSMLLVLVNLTITGKKKYTSYRFDCIRDLRVIEGIKE